MRTNKLISIYTQVYNTKKYLQQCISSVLLQTYTNFEYILVDNGCTDGSSEILEHYRSQDNRIKLIRFEENQQEVINKLINQYATGNYYTIIDSDDWWEPNYLERLVSFLEDYNLDIAITGTITFNESNQSESILRKQNNRICLTLNQFAQNYPYYWTYPSTNWGALMKLDLHRKANFQSIIEHRYVYGGDTMRMLKYLELCKYIGIDSSALYHYRIHAAANSYKYNPKRFEANLAYCGQIRSFLVRHNACDTQKETWLKRVYIYSVGESVRLALGAQNSLQEKLAVCSEIAAHPKTAEAMELPCNERTALLNQLRQFVSATIQHGTEADFRELLPILRCISPKCGPVIT